MTKMTSQFSPRVSEILAYSREEAARLASPSVGPEHLLLGMLRMKEGPVTDVFKRLYIDIPTVKAAVEDKVRKDERNKPINTAEIVLNEKASNILKLAVLEARVQHTNKVDEQHILLAILHDRVDNGAKEILETNNMNYDDVLTLLHATDGEAKDMLDLPDENDDDASDDDLPSNKKNDARNSKTATKTHKETSKTPLLDNFGIDLTQAAAEGKLDPVVGREKEMRRIMEILCRRKKNNPILIGEPGVGKSAIVEGLAQLIADRHTSPILFGKRIINLDLTAIVAGTKYRGQFEERMKGLLKEIESNRDNIIFIDEIQTLVGAGSTPGSMDAANILKPALARGTIQCIGATTLDEYRNSIEKDGALERRFQKVLVEPTTKEETIEILHNIKDRYESHHHVAYTDAALDACVRLTERYVTDRQLPDKAIDALDETGSRVRLASAVFPPEITQRESELANVKDLKFKAVKAQNFELAAMYRDRQTALEKELKALNKEWEESEEKRRDTVSDDEVADVVSMMSGVPVSRMAEAEGIRLKGMADALKGAVIGQDAAIDKIVRSIQRSRVGLKAPNRPIGVFMFLGPTGVGKTYLAKRLAEFMFGSQNDLIRIDMSEYTESFNVSRLIGAPPGYVGYEEGGQLTEKVRRHPYSIILLDEIEKAHGNIYNLLLQVLDEGRLTDGNGRFVNFRNTVIIMTSNAGTKQLKEFGRGVGFTAAAAGIAIDDKDKEHARSIIQKALSRKFSPEFLNRLDEIITFDQLDMDAIMRIVDIELNELYKRINALGYHITVSEEAKKFIATKGYDVQFGARPLKRAIQTYIEDEVSGLIVGGEAVQGCNIAVDKDAAADKLVIDCQS